MNKDFVEELRWRGMLHSMTPGTEEQLQKIWVLRKVISPMDDVEIIELLLDRMSKSKDNEAFLRSMNTSEMG